MPAKRLSMRKIKDVLRLKAQGLSDRKVAQSVKAGRATVRRIQDRAEAAGLDWPLPDDLTESALDALLFPPHPPPGTHQRPVPDWKRIGNSKALLSGKARNGGAGDISMGGPWEVESERGGFEAEVRAIGRERRG